jgi:hypothetical protein
LLAIANYGRFWRRDSIHWGGGNSNPGHLKGFLKSKKSTIVDFREQIGIYVLFDEQKRSVYVGQAGIAESRLFKRLVAHRSDHLRDRWVYFSWFGLRRKNVDSDKLTNHQQPDSKVSGNGTLKDALHEIEAVLISVVEPNLNKRNSNWKGSLEYLQYLDPKLSIEPAVILRNLDKKLDSIEKKLKKLTSKRK